MFTLSFSKSDPLQSSLFEENTYEKNKTLQLGQHDFGKTKLAAIFHTQIEISFAIFKHTYK